VAGAGKGRLRAGACEVGEGVDGCLHARAKDGGDCIVGGGGGEREDEDAGGPVVDCNLVKRGEFGVEGGAGEGVVGGLGGLGGHDGRYVYLYCSLVKAISEASDVR